MRAVHPRSEPAPNGLSALLNTVLGRHLKPAQRRLYTVIVSGALIAIGLGLWYLAGAEPAGRVILVIASIVAGAAIAQSAVRGLANRQVNIELLVTIAAVGAILIGEVWEAAAVTFLFTFGAWLEARTLQGTRRALGELLELAPEIAVVMREGVPTEVSPWEVEQDETVIVRPGMRLAVDGEVISGVSSVNEAAITGEPLPDSKTVGSRVFAGTVNQDGLLQIRATGVGADTTLARIIQRVEEAQEAKAPTQRFIERFAAWYTPSMLVVSAIVWAISGNVHLALTFLVISCPGALVISTPVSIVSGIGRAARKGILIKGGEDLERAGKISAVAFDKTGTLTAGKPVLTTIVPLGADSGQSGHAAQDNVLRLAASAELASEHPLARPIIEAARALGDLPFPDDFQSTTGQGIRANVSGTDVAVGKLDYITGFGVNVPDTARQQLAAMQERGQTAVGVSAGTELIGLLGIEDEIRANAADATALLRKHGVNRLVMLTGDNERTASAIGSAAGISEVHASLLPEEKLEHIHALQRQGEIVAMIGDGINDAPALAAADIGIAMGAAGTDVAIETADIALMTDDLLKLPEAVRLSRLTLSNIKQNTGIALLTVAGLLAGVLAGQVHMAGGMLIHQASVLLVIFNAMRLRNA